MLTFYTKDPAGLLQKFKTKIKAKVGQESIQTWEQVGDNFSHTSERWKGKLAFTAKIDTSENGSNLSFSVASMSKGTQEEQQIVFAYYHGHLLQTFIDNLGNHFTAARYTDNREK